MKENPPQPASANVIDLKNIALYGRTCEQQVLYETIEKSGNNKKNDRVDKNKKKDSRERVIWVTGKSGSGKSFLVQQSFPNIVTAKFESFTCRPYQKLSQSFSEICCRTLEERSPGEILKIKQSLKDSLGDETSVLCNAIPTLVGILVGSSPTKVTKMECRSDWTYERFKRSLCVLLRIVCSRQQPSVCFFDDLQWCDQHSLDILHHVARDDKIQGLTFILSSSDDHSNQNLLKFQNDKSIPSHCLRLGPLHPTHVTEMMADLTLCPEAESIRKLAHCICSKTEGHPLLVNKFLEITVDQKIFQFQNSYWKWDLSRIQQLPALNGILDITRVQMSSLESDTQQALQIAALLGSTFMLSHLRTALEEQVGRTMEDVLLSAEESGLIRRSPVASASSVRYSFAHDKTWEATCSLLPSGPVRDMMHLAIGRTLKEHAETCKDPTLLLIAADQVNHGVHLVTDPVECGEFATFHYEAALLAEKQSAFRTCALYLASAKASIAKVGKWKSKQYSLTFKICTKLAKVSLSVGDYETAHENINEILKNARGDDVLEMYTCRVEAMGAEGSVGEAIDAALGFLKALGENIPRYPSKLLIARDFAKIIWKMRRKLDGDLLNMPFARDARAKTVLTLIRLLIKFCWFEVNPDLYSLLILRMMKWTLKKGIESGYVFVLYGQLLGSSGFFEEGYRFGKLGLECMEKSSWESHSPTETIATAFLTHFKTPWHQCLRPIFHAYHRGMETGDTAFGAIAATTYVQIYFFSGLVLPFLKKDIGVLSSEVARYGHREISECMKVCHQAIINLTEETPDPLLLDGDVMQEKEFLSGSTDSTLQWYNLFKLILGVVFQNTCTSAAAAEHIFRGGRYLDGCHISSFPRLFYLGLASLQQAGETKNRKHKQHARQVIRDLETMAKHGNMNCHHLIKLLHAERKRLDDKISMKEKRMAYDEAIRAASRSGFLNHKALANELAGRFFVECGGQDWAMHYLERSYYLYKDWGATAKARYIGEEFGFSRYSEHDDHSKLYFHPARTRHTIFLAKRHGGGSFDSNKGGGSFSDTGSISEGSRGLENLSSLGSI